MEEVQNRETELTGKLKNSKKATARPDGAMGRTKGN